MKQNNTVAVKAVEVLAELIEDETLIAYQETIESTIQYVFTETADTTEAQAEGFERVRTLMMLRDDLQRLIDASK